MQCNSDIGAVAGVTNDRVTLRIHQCNSDIGAVAGVTNDRVTLRIRKQLRFAHAVIFRRYFHFIIAILSVACLSVCL